MELRFEAPDYRADTTFESAEYELSGSEETGWTIQRNGAPYLELGPGYRLLETERCGVCSTDLDRHFLPFPLPQVTGHELVAHAPGASQRYVVEINASHEARGVESDCAFCNGGLATHCPERTVLGIHALPGGFGPYVLAPVHAIIPVPDAVPSDVAVLVEPFAATLHGVHVTAPSEGDRVAVLGPRRLGMLLVAALAAERSRRGVHFDIVALVRRDELGRLAMRFGADSYELTEQPKHTQSSADSQLADPQPRESDFDIVFDTTGNPDALDHALRRARREVHIKSTHGRPAGGLTTLTAMVVDELRIARLPRVTDSSEAAEFAARVGHFAGTERPVLTWLASSAVPDAISDAFEVIRGDSALVLRDTFEDQPGLPRADGVVVDALGPEVDAIVRPSPDDECSILRPRGTIWIDAGSWSPSSRKETVGIDDSSDSEPPRGAILDAVCAKDLRISTSRCGDFQAALDLLAADAALRDRVRGLVTHQFDSTQIVDAFAMARSPACIKAVVRHDTDSAKADAR
ncbi:MAG: alcohol dehydrogenase catalytic domain-containing protein [Planctomycetes bacterium]|nr:alcohol dehydrogenase catalytic domain-containing protein [Planctomycetota bacterium]